MKHIILFLIVMISIFHFTLAQNDYNRNMYSHWTITDGTSTREKVLREENIDTLFLIEINKKQTIIKGKWICPYSGDTITNPKDLDIDHLVPLGYAHKNGAYKFSRKKKKLYANYLKNPNHLVACRKDLNRSKGKKGPLEWMPPKNKKWYIESFAKICNQWGLKCNIILPDSVKSRLNIK